MVLLQKTADTYRANDLQPVHKKYLEDRLKRYAAALQCIRTNAITDPFSQALVLWDLELFFEVHELLEQEWLKSKATSKLILQAMIRAAGMYIHLNSNNVKGATSMAAKAVAILEKNREKVPAILDLDLLLNSLRKIDPVPPKLSKFL